MLTRWSRWWNYEIKTFKRKND